MAFGLRQARPDECLVVVDWMRQFCAHFSYPFNEAARQRAVADLLDNDQSLTRLVKTQYVETTLPDSGLELIRHYRMLVEQHYRREHQVGFYADQLAKSPKTLTNVFALHEQDSPLQIIHERIGLEARRLLSFTDKSAKEISYELGFEEVSNFSRFFKKMVGLPPSEFKDQVRQPVRT